MHAAWTCLHHDRGGFINKTVNGGWGHSYSFPLILVSNVYQYVYYYFVYISVFVAADDDESLVETDRCYVCALYGKIVADT